MTISGSASTAQMSHKFDSVLQKMDKRSDQPSSQNTTTTSKKIRNSLRDHCEGKEILQQAREEVSLRNKMCEVG
jgi:hypothetical protein